MKKIINEIENRMVTQLTTEQMKVLHNVLCELLPELSTPTSTDYVTLFIAAKRVEGCSDKTLRYYESTLRNVIKAIDKQVCEICTDDLRLYLDGYRNSGGASKTTIDNIRRILSSFFARLEDENYILKSPVRRIHKIKTNRLSYKLTER